MSCQVKLVKVWYNRAGKWLKNLSSSSTGLFDVIAYEFKNLLLLFSCITSGTYFHKLIYLAILSTVGITSPPSSSLIKSLTNKPIKYHFKHFKVLKWPSQRRWMGHGCALNLLAHGLNLLLLKVSSKCSYYHYHRTLRNLGFNF